MPSRFGAALVAALVIALLPAAALAGTIRPSKPAVVQSLVNCAELCTLSVSLSGTGSGTWKSTNSSGVPDGLITCELVNGTVTAASDCQHVYGGVDRVSPLELYYVVKAAVGSTACIPPFCTIDGLINIRVLASSELWEATFAATPRLVTVTTSGAGSGKVISTPEAITCPPDLTCSANFYHGYDVFLTALPDAGAYFAGWTGACAGEPQTCKLTMDGPKTANAVFGFGIAPTAPAPTPRATKAPPTAGPVGPTATPPGPVVTPEVTIAPGASDAPGETMAPATAAPTTASIDPAAEAGSGSPTLILALLAILLIGGGIVVAFFAMRRRAAPAP